MSGLFVMSRRFGYIAEIQARQEMLGTGGTLCVSACKTRSAAVLAAAIYDPPCVIFDYRDESLRLSL